LEITRWILLPAVARFRLDAGPARLVEIAEALDLTIHYAVRLASAG